MSNEEAITILMNLVSVARTGKELEALLMAIEALRMNTDVDFDKVREQFRETDK